MNFLLENKYRIESIAYTTRFHLLKAQMLRNVLLEAQIIHLIEDGTNIFFLTTMDTETEHPSQNISGI